MTAPYPTQSEIQKIYDKREAAVALLGQQQSIEVADIKPLDRLGRFSVADQFWEKCSADTRAALLTDEHHFVRSAASIAATRHS